ncbi:MAG TPA: hypothetical protein VHD32_07005 [Candidatus Didemnitutus sp.]|nr:hypothetical protein [Candidatus Didemnitutus sp.]
MRIRHERLVIPTAARLPINSSDRPVFSTMAALAFSGRLGASAGAFSVLLDRPASASLARAGLPMAQPDQSDLTPMGERDLPPHFRRWSMLR